MSNALISVLTQNNFQLTYDGLLYKVFTKNFFSKMSYLKANCSMKQMREHLAKSGKGLTQIPQLSYGREPFNLNDYFTC